MNGCDSGVVQCGKELRLTLESRDPFTVSSELVRKRFDRYLAIKLGVPRAVHLSHPTRSDWSKDLVGTDACAGMRAINEGLFQNGNLAVSERRIKRSSSETLTSRRYWSVR